MTDFLITPV